MKDASSAAIYGSRAANGVVIITTKSGTNTDGKPIIDLSANVGVTAPSKYLDMLDAAGWAEVTTKAREAAGRAPLEMATDLASKPNNDWQDIMFNPALMQNYNLSVKGGGKYATYYNSIGYTNQDGVVKGTNFQRYTMQSKVDFKKRHLSGRNKCHLVVRPKQASNVRHPWRNDRSYHTGCTNFRKIQSGQCGRIWQHVW